LKFIERIEGVHVTYEALPDHWRKVPEYSSMEFRWVQEPSTRLAALLTEEVHLSDVERAARPEAVDRGMKVLSSSFAAVQFRVYFGGQYYTEPEKLDPDLPWLKKEVRRAMNKAINRQPIVDTIMAGGKVVVPTIYAFHPVLDEAVWPGVFNQEWLDRFDEMYGYDPAKAKELLAEAGYPNGFKFDIYLYTLPGMPEIPEIVQAMALDWEAVGLQPNLINLEFSSVRKKYRSQTISGQMWPIRSYSPPLVHYTAYFLTASTAHGFQTPELDAIWEELNRTVDKSDRSRLLRDMGNIIYDEFAVLQMFGFSAEIMANPKFVAEYVFPGTINGFFTHLEYIDTVPQ
jgi:peptide/nickel transport system substrate-binding protein